MANIVAVDEQVAFRHIEKAGNQMDERAFAGTTGADDSDDFSVAHVEIDILQHGGVGAFTAIGKADVIELYVLRKGGETLGGRFFADIIFGIHEFKNFAGCA
jgi:hypothetical protein